jgi:protein involved in polysaccharide export with SLBB domain
MDHGQYEPELKRIWIGVHGYISKPTFRRFELVLVPPLSAVGLDLLELDEDMA